MSKQSRIILLLVACAVCVLLGVYYLIPGIYHPLTFGGVPTDSHLKHTLLFFGLALLALIATRFVARSGVSRS
jgi:hypothetical protein